MGHQDVVEGHHEAASDESRQNRDEDVRDRLDEAGERVLLLGGDSLGLILGDLSDSHTRQLFVHNVDVTGSHDDLEHAACRECSFDVRIVVQSGLIDLALVNQHEAQACRTVRRCGNVVCASDGCQHRLRNTAMIHVDCSSLNSRGSPA